MLNFEKYIEHVNTAIAKIIKVMVYCAILSGFGLMVLLAMGIGIILQRSIGDVDGLWSVVQYIIGVLTFIFVVSFNVVTGIGATLYIVNQRKKRRDKNVGENISGTV